jgi:hypothetical protein
MTGDKRPTRQEIVMAFSDFTGRLCEQIRFRYYPSQEIEEYLQAIEPPDGEARERGRARREHFLCLWSKSARRGLHSSPSELVRSTTISLCSLSR